MTYLDGKFSITPPLQPNHKDYLNALANTRRMKRNQYEAKFLADPARKAARLPIGNEGEFFTGGLGYLGQDRDCTVISNNDPPANQPSLWCQWVPNKTGTAIQWDGQEKFEEPVLWIEYLIDKLFKPWGYVLNGTVLYQGENIGDVGKIVIENNEVRFLTPRYT